MGGIVYVDYAKDKYIRLCYSIPDAKIYGTFQDYDAPASPEKKQDGAIRILTSNLATCFVVIVAGPGGAIMTHIPAYLTQPKDGLRPGQQKERDDLRKAFDLMWRQYRTDLTRGSAGHVSVVLVKGYMTKDDLMTHFFDEIFYPVTQSKGRTLSCLTELEFTKVANEYIQRWRRTVMLTATSQQQVELWIDGLRKSHTDWQSQPISAVPFGSNTNDLLVHPQLVPPTITAEGDNRLGKKKSFQKILDKFTSGKTVFSGESASKSTPGKTSTTSVPASKDKGPSKDKRK